MSQEGHCIQPGWLNVLRQGERVSFTKQHRFTDRNITADETALTELEKTRQYDDAGDSDRCEVVVGFDVSKLRSLLQLG